MKNDPAEEQSINSNETPLPRNVLSLVKTLQDTNSTEVLPVRSENAKSDLTEEQSIDFNEISLLRNVLNLIKTPQGTNSVKVLLIKNKSRDEYSSSISNSIDYN